MNTLGRGQSCTATNQQSEHTPLLVGSSRNQYTSTSRETSGRRGKGREEEDQREEFSDDTDDSRSPSRTSFTLGSSNQSRSRSRHPPNPLPSPSEPAAWVEDFEPGAKLSGPIGEPSSTAGASAGPSTTSSTRSWWDENVNVTLENKGSVARDHLASERTFLAYMRTSLAIASAGVALVQLYSAASSSSSGGRGSHRLHVYIRPLGAGAVVVGLVVLFIGSVRYFTVQSALVKGSFPVARVANALIATLLTALVTLTFGILLAGKLEARSPSDP